MEPAKRDQPSNYIQTFETLARLKKKERPTLTFEENRCEISVYSSPNNPAKKLFQAGERWWNNTTTTKEIGDLKYFYKCIKRFVLNPTSDVMAYLDYLYRLKNITQRFLDVGLVNYSETCRGGKSNFKKPPPEKLESRKEGVDLLEKKYIKLVNLIQTQIDEYSGTNSERAYQYTRTIMAQMFIPGMDEKKLLNATKDFGVDKVLLEGVKKAFIEQFGETFYNSLANLYHLDSKGVLTQSEIKCLVMSAAANLTMEAILHMHAQGENSLFKPFFDLFPEQLDYWAPESLCQFLQIFRESVYKTWIDRAYNCSEDFLNTVKEDLKWLKTLEPIADHPTADGAIGYRRFGFAETEAREFVYALCKKNRYFQDGILFVDYDENRKLRCMKASSVIAKPGLYGIAILPVANSENPVMQIIFRGTDDIDSVMRDVSLRQRASSKLVEGPGRRSFDESRNEIRNNILKIAKNLTSEFPSAPITIQFIGHSLGGTDAQRALAFCTPSLLKINPRIESIQLYTFNSPGIEKDIANTFIETVNDHPQTIFKLRYFKNAHDALQELGAVFLGYSSNGLSPDNLKISVFKFTAPMASSARQWIKNLIPRRRHYHSHLGVSSLDGKAYCEYVKTTNSDDESLKVGEAEDLPASFLTPDKMKDILTTKTTIYTNKLKHVTKFFSSFRF